MHLNLGDLAREKYDEITENKALLSGEHIGVVAETSRLKLAEALIWSKRIIKARKKTSNAIMIGALTGALLSGLIFFFDLGALVDQFVILAYQIIICAICGVLIYTTIPTKDYFNIQAFFAQAKDIEEDVEDIPDEKGEEEDPDEPVDDTADEEESSIVE